jgi:HK97 family phage prohead protease
VKTKADRAAVTGPERRSYRAKFEIRAAQNGTGGTRYELSGYASVYDEPYKMWDWLGEYDEVVRSGAGTKTLSESPDVVLVFNHAGMPLARTPRDTGAGKLELSEDSTGLHMRAPDLNGERDVVRAVVQAVEEEILDEMSFKFRVMRQLWSPDWEQRDILEYNIHRGDVSVVTYGANPVTSVESALRAQDLDQLPDEAVRALYERLGRRLGQSTDQRQGTSLAFRRALDQDRDADFRALVG